MATPSSEPPASPRRIPGEPAGLLRRLGAMVYDGLLVLALVLTTTGLANVFAPRPEIPEGAASVSIAEMETVTGPLLTLVLLAEIVTFFVYFWVRHGRTLGMQAWHLRVVDTAGDRIGFGAALIRFAVAVPALALGGIGYLWMWVDPARLTWPDRLSATRVVKIPPGAERR